MAKQVVELIDAANAANPYLSHAQRSDMTAEIIEDYFGGKMYAYPVPGKIIQFKLVRLDGKG